MDLFYSAAADTDRKASNNLQKKGMLHKVEASTILAPSD